MTPEELDLKSFVDVVKNSSEYDFTNYSEKSLRRRVVKLLLDLRIDYPTLIENIRDNREMVERVVEIITVNTTDLFRDYQIWLALKTRILPSLRHKSTINIWHAGCSSGQEVYSMLMLLNELGMLEKTKVYGTDINQKILEKAKNGKYRYRYNLNYLLNFDKVINADPLNYNNKLEIPYSKYFDIDKENDLIQMKPFLREKPIFIKHDLVTDPNMFDFKFDLILCRNVIIYFNTCLQYEVTQLFNNNLEDNGYLVLGIYESLQNSPFFTKRDVGYVKKVESSVFGFSPKIGYINT